MNINFGVNQKIVAPVEFFQLNLKARLEIMQVLRRRRSEGAPRYFHAPIAPLGKTRTDCPLTFAHQV